MRSENLLMIFIKNPQLGKVKTRLAKTIGNEKALQVYHLLLNHTNKITQKVEVDKAVFYSDFIAVDDHWSKEGFQQYVQVGEDLGDRMSTAFMSAFNMGYKKVAIIGSDCFELNEDIITDAFTILQQHEFTLGPAKDGGYYLLGMSNYHEQLFKNKAWSTESVLIDTLLDFEKLKGSFKLLPTLSDIDEEKDLENYPNLLEI